MQHHVRSTRVFVRALSPWAFCEQLCAARMRCVPCGEKGQHAWGLLRLDVRVVQTRILFSS